MRLAPQRRTRTSALLTLTAPRSAARRRRSLSMRSECLNGSRATTVVPFAPGSSRSRLRVISCTGAASGARGAWWNIAPLALSLPTSSGCTRSALLHMPAERERCVPRALGQHSGARAGHAGRHADCYTACPARSLTSRPGLVRRSWPRAAASKHNLAQQGATTAVLKRERVVCLRSYQAWLLCIALGRG